MRSERVKFANAVGLELSGYLDLPLTEPRGFAIFAHCFSCSAQSHAARRISQALSAGGIATLRFDFTGLGASEGDFADSDFLANIGDLASAADFLRVRGHAPDLLIGHSLGGAAVIAAAHLIPEVRAVVTVAAPFDPAHVLNLFGAQLEQIRRKGEAEVSLGGRPFKVGREFIEAAEGARQGDRLAALGRPLLILHAPGDAIVPVDQARQIFEAARHPKSYVSLDGSDHLVTDRAMAHQIAGLIAAWAEPYLPRRASALAPAEGTVVVGSTVERFAQEILAAAHLFYADEPAALGGSGAGPTPYDLLLGALGACTGMTIKLVADREGIPLENVRVHLRHERIHMDDGRTGTGRVERIVREIELAGALSDLQRARLMTIATRCPVHRTLEGDLRIETIERMMP